ncbi:MAG: DUF3536 domain-containing protein, partial [Chloroflexota bacterium]|nr:DUF3536 domain-containing protein [Chloroflexota bacterium]
AGVGEYRGHEAYQAMVDEISDAFSTVDLPGVIRLLDRHFGTPTYSLRSLFRDEQRKIMSDILASIWPEIETAYRQIYERHYPLLRFLTELDMPLPKPFRAATEIMLNNNLRQALGSTPLETEHAAGLLNEAKMWKIDLDAEGLGYLLQQTLKETMARLVSTPDDLALLKSLVNTVTLVRSLPFEVNLWQVQNLYYQMLRTIYPGFQKKSRGSPADRDWVTQFISLGEQLSIEVPRAF